MGGAVFLSRILGLVREQVFAFFFGAGMATDAYLVAFRIPNLFRDLFAEGALSSAFVTVFSREKQEERSKEMARNVLTAMVLVVGVFCFLIFLFSPFLVSWMAPEFSQVPGKLELTTTLTRYFSPFLLLVAAAALAMGVLNTKGYFFVPSLGSAAFNLGNIVLGGVGAFWFRDQGAEAMIVAFTLGSVAGGALQWMVQWPLLGKLGYPPLGFFRNFFSFANLKAAFADPALKRIAFLMAPSVLAVAAVQINVLVNTILASSLVEGSVSWLNFAYRLLHFPLGVFGVALSAASLPSFARLLHENKWDEFEHVLRKSLRFTWILGLGSAAGLIAFREPLVSLLYEHGRFSRTDTLECARALTAYALALPALNTTKIFVQVFYARDKVWIPSTMSLLLVVTHYFVAQWGAQHYGHVGIALATSITSWANALILGFVLRAWKMRWVDFETLKVLMASLLGAFMILLFDIFGGAHWIMGLRDTSVLLFTALTLFTVASLGTFYLILAAWPSSELRALLYRGISRFRKT
jgi:putative peptidoglycan lipid II flippase